MIKRYRHWLGEEARHMVESCGGNYVSYSDHAVAIEEKDREIERLRKAVDSAYRDWETKISTYMSHVNSVILK